MNLIVKHEDVGATIKTSIYLDHHHVVSYMPGTRHVETAEATAAEVLTEWLADTLSPHITRIGGRITTESNYEFSEGSWIG
jgi:hypothetical protein